MCTSRRLAQRLRMAKVRGLFRLLFGAVFGQAFLERRDRFGSDLLRFLLVLGKLLGSILSSFWYTFRIDFSTSFLDAFWERLGLRLGGILGSFWELFRSKRPLVAKNTISQKPYVFLWFFHVFSPPRGPKIDASRTSRVSCVAVDFCIDF